MYCRLPAFPIGSEDERIPRRKIDLKCHLQNISPSSLARSIAPPPPEVMLVFPRSVFLARLQPARSSRRFTRA